MMEAEKAKLKEMAHDFIDKDMPALIEIEESRLPVMYQGMVKLVISAVMPQVIAALDAKIDAALAPEVGV